MVYLGPIKAETVTQNVAVQLCENARQQFKEIRFFVEHSYSTLKLLHCTASTTLFPLMVGLNR